MSELFQLKPCEECKGTGIVLIEKHDCDCPDCLGTGFEEPAKRIMNLERELTAITEQRDRLAEAMQQMRSSGDIVICSQSATNLTTNTQTQPKLIHNGVGIADMYSRDEFENAMKRTNQTSVSDEGANQNTKNLS